jgi:hypothetical protein
VRLVLAQALVKRPTPMKPAVPTDWTTVPRVCPKCGYSGRVLPDFGPINRRGVIGAQSWCRKCRSSTHYYNRPRKNAIFGGPLEQAA